jgi:hypothetical protein
MSMTDHNGVDGRGINGKFVSVPKAKFLQSLKQSRVKQKPKVANVKKIF